MRRERNIPLEEAMEAIEELESKLTAVRAVANAALTEKRELRQDVVRLSKVLTPALDVLRQVHDGQEVAHFRISDLFDIAERQAGATAQLAELVRANPREIVPEPQNAADPLPTVVSEPGPIGPVGPKGDKPDHEWVGTSLRFERPDGKWGDLVDLKGPAGKRGSGKAAAPVGLKSPAFTWADGVLIGVAYADGSAKAMTYSDGKLMRVDLTRPGQPTARKDFNYNDDGTLAFIAESDL